MRKCVCWMLFKGSVKQNPPKRVLFFFWNANAFQQVKEARARKLEGHDPGSTLVRLGMSDIADTAIAS